MVKPLFLDGKEYISAGRAAEKTGYASDYIGQLARSGKVPGHLIGRTWFVDFEKLVEYAKNSDAKKIPDSLISESRPQAVVPVQPAAPAAGDISQNGQRRASIEVGREYTSAVEAAKKFGYTSDYIGQLARAGKVPGRLVGRTWYVDLEALEKYKSTPRVSLEKKPAKVRKVQNSNNQNSNLPKPKNYSSAASLKPVRSYHQDIKAYALANGIDIPDLPVSKKSGENDELLKKLSKEKLEATVFTPAEKARKHEELEAQKKAKEGKAEKAVLSPSAPSLKSPYFSRRTLTAIALILVLSGGLTTLGYFSPSLARGLRDKAVLAIDKIQGIRMPFLSFLIPLEPTGLSVDPASNGTSLPAATSTPAQPEEESPQVASTEPTFDVSALKDELLDFIEVRTAKSPVVVYTSPSIEQVSPIIYKTVTYQSDSDVSTLSNAMNDLANGGTLRNNSISSASITDSSFSGRILDSTAGLTTLTFLSATGTSATTTNLFSTLGTFDTLNVSGDASVTGNFTVGGDTTTIGQLLSTRTPTLAHVFTPSWPDGVSNASDATIYINPDSAAPDTNIFAAAVAGAVKFLVDAEGDVYANNLILSGSTSQGETTIAGNLTVQDNVFFGDASTDITTLNSQLLVLASTTLQNFTAQNSTTTNATTTNFFSTRGAFTNLLADTFDLTDFTFVNATGTNSTTTNAYISLLTAGSATTTNLFSTTASSTNLFSTNFNLGTGSIGSLTSSSLTLSSLTSGRIPFASTAGLLTDSSSLTWDNALSQLTAANAIFTTSTTTSATTTNAYISLLTAGNATTTNLFSTTASSTNLFSSLLNVGGNALVVDADGQVGVGTASPGTELDVAGGVRAKSFTIYDNGCAGSITKNGVGNSGDFSIGSCLGGSLRIGSVPSNLQGGAALNSTEFRFISSGSGNGLTIGSWGPWSSSESPLDIWASNVATSRLLSVDYQGKLGWADGTTGTIDSNIYRSAASTLRTNSTFIVDGNVGIGTTTPRAKLELHGTANSSLILAQGNSNSSYRDWAINSGGDAAGGLSFQVGSSAGASPIATANTKLFINSSGNIGIGNTSPSHKLSIGVPDTTSAYSTLNGLEIGSDGNYNGILLSQANATLANMIQFYSTRGTHSSPASVQAGDVLAGINVDYYNGSARSNGSAIQFVAESTNSSNIQFFTSTGATTERMRITSTGNVGIGTTTPQTKLSVSGANALLTIDQSSSGGDHGVQLTDHGSSALAQFTVNTGTGEVKIGATRATYFPTFFSNGSEVMRITTAGNVGIGTTTPTQLLTIQKDSNPYLLINQTSAAAGEFGTQLDFQGLLKAQFTANTVTGEVRMGAVASGYFSTIYSNNSEAIRFKAGQGILIAPANTNATIAAGDLALNVNSYFVSANGTDVKHLIGRNSSGDDVYIDSDGIGTRFGSDLLLTWNTGLYFKPTAGGGTGGWSINPVVGGNFQIKEESLSSTPFVISQTGNVGIGSTTPSQKLTVTGNTIIENGSLYVGTVSVGGSLGNGFQVINHSNTFAESILHAQSQVLGLYANPQSITETGQITYPASSAGLISNTALVLGSSSLEKVRIDTSGRVGIGTTQPDQLLEVSSTTTIPRIEISNLQTSGNYNSAYLYFKGINNPGSNNNEQTKYAVGLRPIDTTHTSFVIQDLASGPDRFTINSVGSIRFNAYGAGTLTTDGSGNITASSDERLKNIQGEFDAGLDELVGINPILYKWNSISGMETEDTYAGFSAQNIQANIPEAVGLDSRGYLTLSDRPILAAAVNAIKELNQKGNLFASSTTASLAGLKIDYISTASSVSDLMNFASSTETRLNSLELKVLTLESATSSGLTLDATTTDAIAGSVFASASTALRNAVYALNDAIVYTYDTAIYATSGIFDKVFARSVHADLICLTDEEGETCVTRSALNAMLAASGSSASSDTSSDYTTTTDNTGDTGRNTSSSTATSTSNQEQGSGTGQVASSTESVATSTESTTSTSATGSTDGGDMTSGTSDTSSSSTTDTAASTDTTPPSTTDTGAVTTADTSTQSSSPTDSTTSTDTNTEQI